MTSPLRQILVHLDSSEGCRQRLSYARQVAAHHGSDLAALYAVTPSFVELPYAPEIGPTFAATFLEIDQQRREAVLKAFDNEMTLPGPMATWAQTDEFPIPGAFAQQACYADLLVLGQHNARGEKAHTLPPDFVESVLIASGRPAIVLPYVGWSGTTAETVAIAWKETAEAVRAVKAAIPLLQRAARVHVFAWGERGPARLGGRGLDLEGYLRLHGVQPLWHHEGNESGSLGELLLSRAFDVGADLLVMGCYGHSRARERVLGGVSRSMLHARRMPLLLAH